MTTTEQDLFTKPTQIEATNGAEYLDVCAKANRGEFTVLVVTIEGNARATFTVRYEEKVCKVLYMNNLQVLPETFNDTGDHCR